MSLNLNVSTPKSATKTLDAHGNEIFAYERLGHDVEGKHRLSAEQVVNYLDQNRTFFHLFPNLLDELSIPHPKSGQAVSLLERQVFQLREQRDALQVAVDLQLDIVGENAELSQKVQQFTKALMATQSEQAAVECIIEQMKTLFKVEHIALVSWDVPKVSVQGMNQLGLSQTWVSALKTTLQAEHPICGLVEKEWQKGLFSTGQAMQSVCLLPLGNTRVWGVLALGSQTDRFHPSLGTYFLKMMAELVSAKLGHLFSHV